MWRGGMKFGRKIISHRKVTKREMRKMGYYKRIYISDPQSLMDKAVVFCLGKLRLGYTTGESGLELFILLKNFKKEGYPLHKLDRMVRSATNKYKFGFEVNRSCRILDK